MDCVTQEAGPRGRTTGEPASSPAGLSDHLGLYPMDGSGSFLESRHYKLALRIVVMHVNFLEIVEHSVDLDLSDAVCAQLRCCSFEFDQHRFDDLQRSGATHLCGQRDCVFMHTLVQAGRVPPHGAHSAPGVLRTCLQAWTKANRDPA